MQQSSQKQQYKFNEQYTAGNKAELRVIELLTKEPPFGGDQVQIHQATGMWQKMGIDIFRMYTVNDGPVQMECYEVKADSITHSTGNIFWETKSPDGTDGCMLKSKAQYLVYVIDRKSVV